MARISLEQLSPSQIVLLRGETFVRNRGNLELSNGARVSSRELAKTLVKVALLACASQEILDLQIQPRKSLFGLLTTPVLFAEPQRASVPWPESTLEAWLTYLAAQLQPEKRHRIQTLVYVFLRENSSNPWQRIVKEVQGGLVALGVLERAEEPRPRALRRIKVAAPIESSVTDLPAEHVREFLQTWRRTNPQIWRLLHREVSRGIAYRRKATERVREGYYYGYG
jgi:hypothetical protein